MNILVFHSARLKSFGPRDTSEEEAFSRSSDIGEQGEAKREAKNENEAGEREREERERDRGGEGGDGGERVLSPLSQVP